ncbi:putative spermidine/putrescine transport system ATP-binding protein [Methylobacterium sp. ap11]|uniref:ABC transporter ATP-binding protein n=1 Tax=Methylobacterium sp. ap11 TaxID=1761799 RepID=UPI0008CD6C5F|nr:ABC transporter ATP-binding protein [Methylobacterium sp. ap11]SEP30008.1 putative spermidine/putrescine transport system ATP-binding protein [Methylobacterium sp. ap11]
MSQSLSSDPGFLAITGAEKRFGDSAVLGGVDLAVTRGEFVSLLGPSGCGKTTLLRIVAGLVSPDRGRVALDGHDITRTPPHRRDVGVVFQNYALFPHLTVAENVAFGLKAKGHPRAGVGGTVSRFLDLVQMAPFADRRAQALSGGQQQRVAVARALAVRPKLLLLDEPFSALDRKLREAMQIDLKRLLRELGITALFVTHDQDEALTMSDRIAVMNRGAIEQLADPVTLYRRPATAFALGFVGLSTRIPGLVREEGAGMLRVETPLGSVRAPGRFLPGSPVLLGVRPERIRIGGDGPNTIEAALVEVAFQGARAHLFFAGPDGSRTLLAETPEIPPGAAPGARMHLSWAVEDTLVFPAEPALREAA